MSGISDFFSDVGNGVENGVKWWWNNVGAGGIEKGAKRGFETGGKAGEPLSEAAMKVPGVEASLAALRYLRDNMVSQPISTALLVGKYNRRNSPWDSDPFRASTWTNAWKAANHISPGQALFLDPKESEKAINSPLLYYKPSDAYLPPGFNKLPQDQQQLVLKEAGLPAIGNQYIEKKRENSSWYRYGTGGIDFAAAIFADPTVHGLNAAGKIARARNVIKAPAGGWSAAQIDTIVNSDRMGRLMDGIWRNKDNPQLLNNTEFAKRSGMGPRFGPLVNALNDPEELNLFIRTGMGDVAAKDELLSRNVVIAQRMATIDQRMTNLGLMRGRYINQPQIMATIDSQMDLAQQALNADATISKRYTDILNQEGLLDKLHVARWVGPDAARITRAQNKYTTGAARGFVADDAGIVHHRLYGSGGYFQGPVHLIRMIQNAHPNGHMEIGMNQSPKALQESVAELRGHISRIPGLNPGMRQDLVNQYLKATTEHQRKDVLEEIGRLGVRNVAKKHGVTTDIADELYKEYIRRKYGFVETIKDRFTAALDPERVNAAGKPMHLDEIPDTGGNVVLTPYTVDRIMNGHTLQDMDILNKVLARHGDRLMTLRAKSGNARDAVENGSEYLTYLWKFTTLFRLGYIPRVLGDDLGSQWAAVGTAAMALRGYKGLFNAFDNAARRLAKPALQAREAGALAGADYAAEEMAILKPQVAALQRGLFKEVRQRVQDVTTAQRGNDVAQRALGRLDPADRSPKAMAVRNFASQRAAQLRAAQLRHRAGASPGKTQQLNDMIDRHDWLSRYHNLTTRQAAEYNAAYQKVIQGSKHVMIDGRPFSAAFEGKSGQYALSQISADESVGNMFASNKQLIRGNLERSFNHGGRVISATQNPAEHLTAWTHAINNQIMQNAMSKLAVKGWSIEEITHWLKTDAEGIAYRNRLPKNIEPEEFARSAKYEVDQYLHTPEIRMQAQTPEGVTGTFLDKAVPTVADRPDVHTGEIGLSQLQHMNALDRTITRFYRVAATLPANRMSRHPLFNQFYEGHVERAARQWMKQTGRPVDRISVKDVDQMAHSARELALRDTRALVFDIAHRSDAAAAMRFLSPFFSATTEAFQRWGRVIADKPGTVGYAATWFNAPAAMGAMQDLDGNKIDEFGYTYIPQYPVDENGNPDYSQKPKIIKRRVPKNERYIITRLPKWVVDSPVGYALNVRESNGGLLLSQNSINMVTQGDPWFNPGMGPVVQIPVNEFVADKPFGAELSLSVAKKARSLGILPFGPTGGGSFGDNPFGRAINVASPAQFKAAMTAMDTSDERYQLIKMQIMNKEIYNFEQEHQGRRPTTQEMGSLQKKIADRTRNYWFFQAAAQFIQPFATQRKDPNQFYYDQYNILRRQNPKTADDEFLKRYDESHFIFASEITKSMGIPPTDKALKLAREHATELAQNPELAPLVIGPEGNGPFSPEAYYYELNNPLVPGGAEMMRSKLTAEQAVAENQRRLGWSKYTAKMNKVTADLKKAGFASFDDPGAEDFKDTRSAWTKLYSEPLYPDGTPNPYYNEAWSKDFFTQDARKYERLIPGLTAIANSPMADEPARSDLRKLQEYLGGRRALLSDLNERKLAGLPYTLAAQDNEDLRYQWGSFVDGLIEESPRFGDLYHRYLSRDMGVNAEEEVQQ